MDKAEIFRQVTMRNALRGAAQLPLLDVRAEFHKAVTLAAMREYDEIRLRYKADEERILAVVWSEYRQRHGAGFGASSLGRLAVHHEADRRMTTFLNARGFVRPYLPAPAGVYGAAKRVEDSRPASRPVTRANRPAPSCLLAATRPLEEVQHHGVDHHPA